MPNGQPTFEFEQDGQRHSFEVQPDGAIRVTVSSGGRGFTFGLSIVAAQRFDVMLSAAITRAINNR